ncbi:MAG: phosphatase PAP2 family protein [Candidatus Rokubacteria bacterium]|nr:phosphatase PAP2 family protein [Candidatus Rokubacteria bacterium]
MGASRWRTVFLWSGGVFVALALFARFSGPLPGERALYDSIVSSASPLVVSIFHGINYLGDKRVLLPATLFLLWISPAEARRQWWLWAGVMVSAPILEGLAKEIIGRPRPVGNAFGFPSGHVTAASAYFFLAAYLIAKRLNDSGGRVMVLWIAAGITVALVAVARLVLQAHWPADALGGTALGLGCVAFAAWWHERSRMAGQPRT